MGIIVNSIKDSRMCLDTIESTGFTSGGLDLAVLGADVLKERSIGSLKEGSLACGIISECRDIG